MCTQRDTTIRIVALGGVLLLLGWTSACATKKYVKQNVTGPLEAKIGNVDKKVDQKAGEADNRITDLDRKTEQGISNAQSSADKAGQQATKAGKDALDAQDLAHRGLARTDEIEQQVENIDNYQPVKSETVLFAFDRSALTDEDVQKLDALLQSVSPMKHYVIQVEGFTDKTGSYSYNLELSRRRAEEVTRYLTAHNIPLLRIHELGYGSQPPASAENDNGRTLRKLSRRVEIKVLAPASAVQSQAGQNTSPAKTLAEERPVSNE